MLKYEMHYWRSGFDYIAGVDEVGRGPLAGPVVSAAVILPEGITIPGVDDSKKISAKKREMLFPVITDKAIAIGIGIIGEQEIDEINILNATHKAMRVALSQLTIQPNIVMVDGNEADIGKFKQVNIVKGDQKSMSIAAASIVAKVTRDRMMVDYDRIYPEYGFANHKGYGTKFHIEALKKYFACPIHRRSFRPVSGYLPNQSKNS